MSWISKLFSAAGANIVTSIGKILDDITTTDEEIALTDIQKAKIKSAYEIEMQRILLEFTHQAELHEKHLEEELTKRLKLDMKSDSWMSKNIRPMTLVFMTLIVSTLSFFTIFNSNFNEAQLDTIKSWIPFFQTIMLTIYGFYFGSRGLEKIQKIRSDRPSTSKARAEGLLFNQSAD